MYRSNSIAALLLLAGVLFALVVGNNRSLQAEPTYGESGYSGLAAPLASGEGAPAMTLTQTAAVLAATDAPGRDLIALTQKLKLHNRSTIPPVVNATPPNYKVGDSHTFYIADVARREYFTATATIWFVTPHAYWYVKDRYNVSLPALEAAAQYFEANIYPTNHKVFGSEINPGVDNDQHITVLLALVPGVGGYFSNADAYPKSVNPYSNERDMIYLASVPKGDPGSPDNYFMATLAHEFQHMIHWNVHRNREVWVDEGASEVAMYLNGYNPGGADTAFVVLPDTQLNAWDDTAHALPHYGASYLFLRYLMDRFGDERFMSSLLHSNRLGGAGFDQALSTLGYTGEFDGAFEDWTIANVLNDSKLADGRYSYSEGGRVAAARTLNTYPATRSETVHQYGTDYIRLSGDVVSATISFKGDSTVGVINAKPQGGAFWYSNRRDSGDSTFTRDFDLTHVQRATLQFSAWFDIEAMFDYAYIEASTNGGATWYPLQGKYTTPDNPNGNSFGPAWTGVSGAVPNGTNKNKPVWVDESVDLSKYTGTKVKIRFEYITDEGYNRPGMAIDDLRVPEIGWSDDAESDAGGWQSAGWVRIGSQMPEKWFVALIEKGLGGQNRVREMQVASDGTGTLSLDSLGADSTTREAILVIAALAPKTTEIANYSVTVSPAGP
jgi:immune inhibitor A